MGHFQVRYDSRVVIYERKMFIILATGLVVMGGDSCSAPLKYIEAAQKRPCKWFIYFTKNIQNKTSLWSV